MNHLRKLLKAVILLCLITLALCGIGTSTGPLFTQNKERYSDHGIRTELVMTKDEDADTTQADESKS
ncbi:hypothetical protein [Spirosoma agri]|uniref:Uncharacterized protein n=1 Tax=Spirosoma agri TaxID=1987381 RepID=A0A6M0IEW8_9BACT|nr:hypothetical protein [Spirosoma agri]NEU66335.1 hypothetical protein [Spirosoma agri]